MQSNTGEDPDYFGPVEHVAEKPREPDHLLLLVRLTPRTLDRYGRGWREQAQAALKMHWRAAGAAAVDYTLVTAEQGEQVMEQARQVGQTVGGQGMGPARQATDTGLESHKCSNGKGLGVLCAYAGVSGRRGPLTPGELNHEK